MQAGSRAAIRMLGTAGRWCALHDDSAEEYPAQAQGVPASPCRPSLMIRPTMVLRLAPSRNMPMSDGSATMEGVEDDEHAHEQRQEARRVERRLGHPMDAKISGPLIRALML